MSAPTLDYMAVEDVFVTGDHRSAVRDSLCMNRALEIPALHGHPSLGASNNRCRDTVKRILDSIVELTCDSGEV